MCQRKLDPATRDFMFWSRAYVCHLREVDEFHVEKGGYGLLGGLQQMIEKKVFENLKAGVNMAAGKQLKLSAKAFPEQDWDVTVKDYLLELSADILDEVSIPVSAILEDVDAFIGAMAE